MPPAPGDTGPQVRLDEASRFVFEIEPEVAKITTLSPSSDLDIVILDEVFAMASASPGTYESTPDLGTFALAPEQTVFDIPTTTARYTLPGAHLVPWSRMAVLIPVDAVVEGWSLYALSLLHTPPPQLELHLALEATRTATDTGIHDRGWTYDHAIRFVQENFPAGKAFAQRMVDRVIAEPGRGVAAFVGYRELRRLEEESREALGSEFSLDAFIKAVIGEGERPFAIIARNVAAL